MRLATALPRLTDLPSPEVVPALAMVCESISNIALYVSFSRHTSTRPMRMGLPILSFTLMGSTSRLRARRESFLASMKGFTQKKPVSRNVPLYLPKNTMARASLGSSIM